MFFQISRVAPKLEKFPVEFNQSSTGAEAKIGVLLTGESSEAPEQILPLLLECADGLRSRRLITFN